LKKQPDDDETMLTEDEILKDGRQGLHERGSNRVLQGRLEQLQADISKNAGQTTENSGNLIVPDPADRATIEEDSLNCARVTANASAEEVQQSACAHRSGDTGGARKRGEPIGIPA